MDQNTPMTVAGVGIPHGPTRWVYSTYGDFVSVYGINNHIAVTFNTKSIQDVERKVHELEAMRDKGLCSQDDISEIKERLKTLCNLSSTGRPQVFGVDESGTKGSIEIVYRDGQPIKVKRRGKQVATEAQRKAAENARQYAHTDEANAKRRKSISARGDGKILGEV